MVDEARRPTRWWVGWLVALLIIEAFTFGGLFLGMAVLGNPADTDARSQYEEVFSVLATLLGLFLWVRFKEGRRFSSLGFRPSRDWVKLLLGFLIGGAMMSVGVLLGLATGAYGNGLSPHSLNGSSAVLALLPLILVFLLQGTNEESIVRGYMLQVGARQLPGWVAILVTSAIFTVIHTLNPLTFLNIMLYAVFACLVALRQGSLWLIAGIHGGWNFFQGNVFGLPVSGLNYATSLFTVGPVPGASTMLNGGAFGLEAGLLGTLVLTSPPSSPTCGTAQPKEGLKPRSRRVTWRFSQDGFRPALHQHIG